MPAGAAYKRLRPATGELNTTNHSVILPAPLAPLPTRSAFYRRNFQVPRIKKEFKGIGEKGKGPRVGVTCPARICSWAWNGRNCPGSAGDTAWFLRHAHRASIKGPQEGQKNAEHFPGDAGKIGTLGTRRPAWCHRKLGQKRAENPDCQ